MSGKHTPAKNCKIPEWLTARADRREGRFIQIGNSFLLSEKAASLSCGARWLYFCMADEAGGKRDFTFPLRAAKKYHIAPASFRRYVSELVAGGFIVRQSGRTTREDNLFSFTSQWKNE